MSAAYLLSLAALLGVLTLAAYVDRVYSEMGKFLAREYQDNIDAWTTLVEPRLRMGRESIELSASVLRQLSLVAIALLAGVQLSDHSSLLPLPGHPVGVAEIARTAFELILIVIVFGRLLPQLCFTRTRGVWPVRITYLLQALFYLVLPVTLLLGLLQSIAALAEPEEAAEPEHPSEAMDALLEAGEEEGILEESDRDLVRSVVEFGDKVVREVMTPRPEMFAVPGTMTLAAFNLELIEHAFSRVPVYGDSLDQITGIAFARDLLHVADADAARRTVAEIQRPAAFVPELKKVNELLREMQREKQHMGIVIDEYGGVAGIVTIEDLLEAIVGNIADEHDEPEEDDAPVREANGAYVVSGSFEVARLRELFADALREVEANRVEDAAAGGDEHAEVRIPQHYEATTLGGLVSEIAGHIPLVGEVIQDEALRFEVLASTDRLVERVRVSLIASTPTPDDAA